MSLVDELEAALVGLGDDMTHSCHSGHHSPEYASEIIAALAACGIDLELAYQWQRVETVLAAKGWDWRIAIKHHSSGDGYSELYTEDFRALSAFADALKAQK